MKFNLEQIKKLEENANILRVLPNRIYYTNEFKERAIAEYEAGKPSRQIFIEAGFNVQELSKLYDYESRMISKWRSAKSTSNNIHYPQKKIKENRTNYQKMQARLEYLEAENEFLKKLHALNEQFR